MIIAVTMDLSKAFDTLDHAILLDKLKAYGVEGLLHSWIESYLTSCSQSTKVNGMLSGMIDVKCGVLGKGSILGPLLFLIYINNISNHICNGQFILYVDDCTYSFPTENPDASLDKVSKDLN